MIHINRTESSSKHYLLMGVCLLFTMTTYAKSIVMSRPDSAYLFAYARTVNGGHNGLHFAWSLNKKDWHAVGQEYGFLRCDYGRWGTQKRMVSPFLYHAPDGVWHAVWAVNEIDGVFAHAASKDLIHWQRQSYPVVRDKQNCLTPTLSFDQKQQQYIISWLSEQDTEKQFYTVTTTDFKEYSQAKAMETFTNGREQALIGDHQEEGTIHRVAWSVIDQLMQAQQLAAYRGGLWAERAVDDATRFADLKPVEAHIQVDTAHAKKISDLLLGVFFEDINYAADGGLYAELVQNRDFEYNPADKEGKDQSWNHRKAWVANNSSLTWQLDSVAPIHPNNKHYAVLQVNHVGLGLVNEGFDGIAIQNEATYRFSVFARTKGKGHPLRVRLIGRDGAVYAEGQTKTIDRDWKKYEIILTAKHTVADAQLEIVPLATGYTALDMISLFPVQTFKGRKNGMRQDLAQAIADIHPRFVRFPGGCVAHGDGLENMYRWKQTIGPLETRKPQRNLWGYHQTAGLGYFEYFQFCEDIGAEPVPVVAAGVPCQNSATGGAGQQGGIPLDKMDDYIQEVLDLIEYANGDAHSTWGRKRAEAGHPAPFHLKYIGVGNEDLITDIFEERFTMIYKAVKEKYPEITVIGTVGPWFEGTDYTEGWKIADKLHVPMVDEHYYQSPGWFIHNQDFYDQYDRSKAKVYLGEYAAHLPGRPNNMETALAEALYLTTLERNGDVVHMASYAPLLAKEGHTQWNPDLIYFNNTTVKPTVGYYVQQLYGENAGHVYIPSTITLSDPKESVKKRIAVSIVRDEQTDDLIVKWVNLLPVAVRTTTDLTAFISEELRAIQTVLQGDPTDKQARPVRSTVHVQPQFKMDLPPYSFTVLRLKTSHELL